MELSPVCRTRDSHQSVLRKLPPQAPVLGPLGLPSFPSHSLPPPSSSLLSRPRRVPVAKGSRGVSAGRKTAKGRKRSGLAAGGADACAVQGSSPGPAPQNCPPESCPHHTCHHATPEALHVNTGGRTGVHMGFPRGVSG